MKINKIRVGAVPYVVKDGELWFYFMVPSDPAYGGPHPQIAKGQYEGESTLKSEALREAEEELGLKPSNIRHAFHVFTSKQKTKRGENQFHVWAVDIINMNDFKRPHWETGETHWLRESELKSRLRKDHLIPMYNLIRKVKQKENLL
jgi:ADP-ribose pyrophosphatase YjhB (NUDIX family)